MSAVMVTEDALPSFRAEHLDPAVLHVQLGRTDETLLVSVPPGIGKTHAAHGLVSHALEHGHDLVVYVAPTRALIAELLDAPMPPGGRGRTLVLDPRPKRRCGGRNEEWEALERASCSALAKQTLCKSCPGNMAQDPCPWPDQMARLEDGVKVVVMTEQYLALQPSLIPSVVAKTGAAKPLVIFDEATFMLKATERVITRPDLTAFRETLRDIAGFDDVQGVQSWRHQLDALLETPDLIHDVAFDPTSIGAHAIDIQRHGRCRFGDRFRYLAHDLALLNSPVATGRWSREDQFVVVTGIETTGCHVAVFAPYLPAEIVRQRLDRPVRDAITGVEFRHSATRFVNIADGIGSMRSLSMSEHFNRTVDFFLALTLRNRLEGKRTVLVTKKGLVDRVRERFEATSAALDRPLQCNVGAGGDPSGDVVLIHYGIVGVNALKDFDAIYCIGAYNARPDLVRDVYAQTLAPDQRPQFRITTVDGARRLAGADGEHGSRFHAAEAGPTLALLERRVVLQAVGRVRPFTSPAEVVTFQCDDLSAELGEVEVHASLNAARSAWGVPLFSQMQTSVLGDRMRPMREEGASFGAAASAFGVSKSTAHKALTAPRLDDLLRGIGR